MLPHRCRCVICGYLILQKEFRAGPWQSDFRAVYKDSSREHITGVGLCDGDELNDLFAPLDPTLHWDHPSEDSIPLMQQRVVDPRQDFLLHDACWALLREYLPGGFSLRRLREVLKSVPSLFCEDGRSSDHNYDGLIVYDNSAYYPWESHPADTRHPIPSPPVDSPCEILDIRTLTAQAPPVSEYLFPNCQNTSPPEKGRDCSSVFPLEIIEAVASLLSTHDALNLRFVSRAFQDLLFSQYFWASRFLTHGERGFVLEARRACSTNWLNLYRYTGSECQSLALRNRKRIWTLLESLAELLCLSLASNANHCFLDFDSADHEWNEVQGYLRGNLESDNHEKFTEGCRILGWHIVNVPPELSVITFSKVNVGPLSFITGIRLQNSEGETFDMGYIGGSQISLYEVRFLKGFVLAIGMRGIHAIRVVSDNRTLSGWVGDPGESPVTERLAIADVVDIIRVGFDGYKLVSLGVSVRKPSLRAAARIPLTIRQKAIWYPTVPSPDLKLNEIYFTGEDPSQSGYQPLCWIYFGGPGGENLRYITGISFLYTGFRIHSLQFHYDNSSNDLVTCTLGRYELARFPELPFFAIDGAGGEKIEAVCVSLTRYTAPNAYGFLKHGKLSYVKLTTSYQRDLCIGKLTDNGSVMSLFIEPGTTITGLYAGKHPEFGLISLGVISERTGPRAPYS